MNKNASALVSGLIFGIGLSVSEMINPQKVLNFLDVAGSWDASLALVMAGALTVAGVLQRLISKKYAAPLSEVAFYQPKLTKVDRNLIIGATIFGAGWGLSGFCPAPAISAISSGDVTALVFTTAMFSGMWLFKILHRSK